MKDFRIEKLANNLLNHSINLQSGEKILIEIIGIDAVPLGKELIKQAENIGAIPLFNIIDYEIMREMLKNATKEQMQMYAKHDLQRMMDIDARRNNRDGAALRFTAEQLSKRPEDVKLLIIVSDGQPAASGYSGTASEEDLRGIKQEYQKKGILFVAAAIGDDKVNIERIYGDSFLDITDLNQLPTKLTAVVKRYIRV